MGPQHEQPAVPVDVRAEQPRVPDIACNGTVVPDLRLPAVNLAAGHLNRLHPADPGSADQDAYIVLSPAPLDERGNLGNGAAVGPDQTGLLIGGRWTRTEGADLRTFWQMVGRAEEILSRGLESQVVML